MDFGKQGASEMNLVALIPGDPDPALFSTAADFKEVPPSAYPRPTNEKCGPECPGLTKEAP
jgi:hypothetical protein